MLNIKLPKFRYKKTLSLLTNGDFYTKDLTGWTAAAGWSTATGKAVHTAGIADTTPLVQAVNLVNGMTYEVGVRTSGRTAGTLTLTFGALAGSYALTLDGMYWQEFTATSSAAFDLTFTPTATFDGAVDEITARPAVAVFPEYPDLEDRADGALVPIAYGDLHGVIPVAIDNVYVHHPLTYKVAGHAIHAIDTVWNGDESLAPGTGYSTDLALAEFTLISTPYLEANTTYYFVVEADYPVNATNYVNLVKTATAGYAGGQVFTIDAGGTWTPVAADLFFMILGKSTLAGQSVRLIDTRSYLRGAGIGLRSSAAQTRIAQSFATGASPFYLTSVSIWTTNKGTFPSGNFRIAILSAYNPAEVQVGQKSRITPIDSSVTWAAYSVYFPLHSEASNLTCEIEGAEKAGTPIKDGADMLEDLVVNRIGKSSSILEPTALANLKAERAAEIAAYIDRDITFGEIVGKLESSLLFKFVPLHDGTYATIVYEADAGTAPHFFDEHFLSFSMRHDFSALKNIVKIKYDENPGNNEFKVAEASSYAVLFVYGTGETLEVETYLKRHADATALAADYLAMYETPPLEVTFEVRGYGLDLIPGRDKVRITRTRAAYAGGAISGILFRIVQITKKPATASTEIVCILDTQTY